jgi:monovalent cation:H+ antiporter-2, CPA2 family
MHAEGAVGLLELGAIIVGLAVLARLAGRVGFSAAPLYLIAGLALGDGGLLPLVTTRSFVELGAEIGVILLLFMLGLEYSARELLAGVRSTPWSGALDLALNFPPGFLAGLLMGWGLLSALLLGGITFVTSSGIVAKLLKDLGRERAPESRIVISLLLIEDLSMVVYLPVMGALAAGGLAWSGLGWVALALSVVAALLWLATHVDVGISRGLFSENDETLLLTIVGFAVILAGVAQQLKISAAIGALLAGILLSGPAARGARVLLSPLRDLFAAIFFFFIGLTVDPSTIPPVLGLAVSLAAVGAVTKFLTGLWSAKRGGMGSDAGVRAGVLLIPRGELSIAIAGLGAAAGADPRLTALAVAYVLVLSLVGPIAVRAVARRHEGGSVEPERTA